jgi:hypothetical protein
MYTDSKYIGKSKKKNAYCTTYLARQNTDFIKICNDVWKHVSSTEVLTNFSPFWSQANEQNVGWHFQDSLASTIRDLVTVYLSQGESRRPSLPKRSAEYGGWCRRGMGSEGRLIYGPGAGQHLTYRGDMLVNEWANEAAELTTQDPSSKTHALCVPQTTGRVTQRKQNTIALRMLHS